MMQIAPSARRLRTWLESINRNQKWLSKVLGTTQPTVYRWVTGEFRPEAHFRRAIQHLSEGDVPFDGWFYPEELAIVQLYKDKRNRERAFGEARRPPENERPGDAHEKKGRQQD